MCVVRKPSSMKRDATLRRAGAGGAQHATQVSQANSVKGVAPRCGRYRSKLFCAMDTTLNAYAALTRQG